MTVSLDTSPPPLTPKGYAPFYEENAPRAVVVLDGSPFVCRDYTIEGNAHGSTDTATITLPISSNPDFSQLLFRGSTTYQTSQQLQALSTQQLNAIVSGSSTSTGTGAGGLDLSPIIVEIYAGFPANPAVNSTAIAQLSRRFLGIVDLYSASFHDDIVTFRCRSLAAPLVDDKVTNVATGQSTVNFVQTMAAKYGLLAVINTRPGTPTNIGEVLAAQNMGGPSFAGQIYGMRVWELMLRCAQFDDVDLWVQNDVLHYEAPDLINRGAPIALKWGRDWHELSGTHAPQFSKKIRVEVRTYSPRVRTSTTARVETADGGGVTVTQSTRTVTSSAVFGTNQSVSQSTSPEGVTSTTTSSATGGGFRAIANQGPRETGLEIYTIYVRGVTPERANLLARAYWRQLSMHEYAIEGIVPMTHDLLNRLSISSLLSVSGAPYAHFNQPQYWPRQINESFSLDEGWRVRFAAVNHQPPNGAV